VTGEPPVSSSPVQHTVQHCIIGQERGIRCLPVVPGSLYCDNHHPDRKDRRRENNRLAARASHIRRVTPEMEAWADSLDLTTDEGRAQSLTDVARLVAKEGLTPAQGNAIAALARAAGIKATKPSTEPKSIVVEVAKYGQNGAAG
jgi:hypothetical protein